VGEGNVLLTLGSEKEGGVVKNNCIKGRVLGKWELPSDWDCQIETKLQERLGGR